MKNHLKKLIRYKWLLLISFVVGTVGIVVLHSAQVFAATTPAQCLVNGNILGGPPAYIQLNCSDVSGATGVVDGHCYNADSAPKEIDCSTPPILGQWNLVCADGVTRGATQISSDPEQVCESTGSTYPGGSSGATPVNGAGTGPTIVPPSSPPSDTVGTAPSGSGSTTGNEKVTLAPNAKDDIKGNTNDGKYYCGSDPTKEVHLSINLGCVHKDPAILDMLFAIIRLLSVGVGVVVVGSIVVAGIQYTASRGNPGEVAKARERIMNAVIALIIFIFSFAILNWIVPAGLLK